MLLPLGSVTVIRHCFPYLGSGSSFCSADSTASEPFSSQAFLPGPESATYSQPTKIPAVNVGSRFLPAGDWARYIKQIPWPVAIKGKQLKSDLLRSLVGKPSKNELSIRWGERARWTPSATAAKIGSRIANVEAALIQIVGTESSPACDTCQKDFGPFSHCVTAPGALECGNCHWSGNASRCTLPPTPIATPAPTSHPRTFSEEQRREWETRRADVQAEQARLEQAEDALMQKIQALHTKVDLVQRVFTCLGLAGQSTEASTIYETGCDRVADVHQSINELEKELRVVVKAYGRTSVNPLAPLISIFDGALGFCSGEVRGYSGFAWMIWATQCMGWGFYQQSICQNIEFLAFFLVSYKVLLVMFTLHHYVQAYLGIQNISSSLKY